MAGCHFHEDPIRKDGGARRKVIGLPGRRVDRNVDRDDDVTRETSVSEPDGAGRDGGAEVPRGDTATLRDEVDVERPGPTSLETLAVRAGLDPEELRVLLEREVERRRVVHDGDSPETPPGHHRQRI